MSIAQPTTSKTRTRSKRKNQAQQADNKLDEKCRFYAQGQCKFGDLCKCSHEGPQIGGQTVRTFEFLSLRERCAQQEFGGSVTLRLTYRSLRIPRYLAMYHLPRQTHIRMLASHLMGIPTSVLPPIFKPKSHACPGPNRARVSLAANADLIIL